MRAKNIGTMPLKRKLKRYKYLPHTRERVIEAIERVEHYAKNCSRDSLFVGDVGILTRLARTQLNGEAPEGMEWKLMKKGSRSVEMYARLGLVDRDSAFMYRRLGIEHAEWSPKGPCIHKIRFHVEFL
jgi:hypothetical protein